VSFSLPLSILTQTDFEERQEQSAAQPGRDQSDEQHLAGQSAHQYATRHTGDNEHAG
jgi:hypothetical protein